MKKSSIWLAGAALACLAASPACVQGAQTQFNFLGNGGFGLLPGNEVGANTPIAAGAAPSVALGGESGAGLLYDDVTSMLAFDFAFSGLSGGLADAASGIHFHIVTPGGDPLSKTGGIALNLNSGADANVMLSTPTIAIGSSAGSVAGSALLTPAQTADLFAGRIYLNIHSGGFGGGELRGNLVAVPEPAGQALAWVALCGVLALAIGRPAVKQS
ncbi:CHRD domain protein [Pirellulimonas nuda]|uniref:CHRD domain protein n=1 Tax=Pirellulimonas nuda TaxID=2528009 RepID=A0A518D679_9BACT|nr:CHRD domain-containing protein [Pirellulimonas nuda]QDU86978.1 CHRD domain protein [Pirellulimonas nuda]